MTIYWPRRSDGLPPGQRLMHDMPRFTDDPFRPPPDLPACAVTFSVDRQPSRWSPRPISKQWGSTTIVSTSTASQHGRSRISSGPVSRCATSPSPSGACSQKRQLVQRCEHGWLRGSRRGHPGSGGQASDQDNSSQAGIGNHDGQIRSKCITPQAGASPITGHTVITDTNPDRSTRPASTDPQLHHHRRRSAADPLGQASHISVPEPQPRSASYRRLPDAHRSGSVRGRINQGSGRGYYRARNDHLRDERAPKAPSSVDCRNQQEPIHSAHTRPSETAHRRPLGYTGGRG